MDPLEPMVDDATVDNVAVLTMPDLTCFVSLAGLGFVRLRQSYRLFHIFGGKVW